MITLKLSKPTRAILVAALVAYFEYSLARDISSVPDRDPADDGPEVEILSVDRDA